MAERFREVLNNVTAADLIAKDRDVYSVCKDTTVEETLQVLARCSVLSVPVKDSNDADTYGNFVDTSDILAFLASLCKDTNSLVQLKVDTFTNQKVGEITNLSNKDPFITVAETEAAQKILELFSDRIHRVVLTDGAGKTTNVLSQFDFLKYITTNMDSFQDLAKQSIKELGMVHSWVLQVRKTERAFACFKKMSENGVNGLSIVDNVGKLDAHISSSALRGLTSDTFKALRLPVEEFLAAQKIPVAKTHVCRDSASFEEVLRQLEETGAHRLYVEDEAGFPVGVVSLTDVCSVLKMK